ncbi:MAG: dienelactone hydrolase family protein [Dehalococcoidia bacterium]
MPGNMWDEPEEPAQDLDLRLLRVGAQPFDDSGALRVLLDTTRGQIEGILHPVEGGTSAVICVGGAMGGLDGPADSLYARLPLLLSSAKVTVLRIEYRKPNEFEECVLDALAGCSFMKGIGATDLVLVGHSFGGAVVVKAGELHDMVRGVVSMSPQLFGTRQVENLNRPLLLVHGVSDTILSHEASEDIYRRALEPKRIVLYAEAGHSLIQAKQQIDDLLADWIPARLGGVPEPGGREEHESTA